IGRSICGNGKPLYDYLPGYNGDQMAAELNMQSKHSLEKAAATQADCFTTVSEVTARECEQLLERRPDVVTPNGFEENFVPAKTKYKAARKAARACMLRVAQALTGSEYTDDTFIVATSGRCEYRNKGIDLYLDAIARLGDLDPERRILAFVMVPAWVKDPRADLAHALSIGATRRLEAPVTTHTLNNPFDDPILSRINTIGFTNDERSRITVIYVPCYLNGNDGIFNMPYYDLLPGLDASVFPSYYEPWGYTPLESVAFAVPTITTTLSGFGQWVITDGNEGFDKSGVAVVPRGDFNYNEVKESIATLLRTLVNAPASQMQQYREAARRTAAAAAWEKFFVHYAQAYTKAIENAEGRLSF
ncbi:MAG: glycosyltransferase, partial [Lachnoclostridium sp.]|nr:glycosyltransferase [Lachnoclostridium sp.]